MTSIRRTRRWRGIVAVALSAAGIGLLFQRPSVLLLSLVGVAYAAYPQVPSPPEVALDLERTLDEDEPGHGDAVTVTVTLHNEGRGTLADLRVIDGVPPMLVVSEGSPRHAATLRPGGKTSFSYTVTAKHGTHGFEPATVVARDVAGATEVETTVATETTIDCVGEVPELPLRRQTHSFVGEIVTDEGGTGVEFHRTREYEPGDSLAQIHWARYAKTRELATIEFREERGAAVVLCVDAREPAYRRATPEDPHGVAYARAAGEQLLTALADTTDTVGIAALSEREHCWLAPGAGREHLDRARHLLSSHPALSTYPPDPAGGWGGGGGWGGWGGGDPADATDATDGGDGSDESRWDERLTALRRELGAETQVVLLSPLADEFAVEAALTLEASGHAVTVISPDVAAEGTVGERLARTERANRIHTLRESGVRVVDWPPANPLGSVLMRARDRWSG